MAFPNYGYGTASGGGMMPGSDASGGGYNPRLHYQAAKNAGFELNSVDDQPKTVYIGNLDLSITEEFIAALYGQIGVVVKTKLISDGFVAYAFVEFADHNTAVQCVQTMNKRSLLGKEMKVNWATEHYATQPKVDTSNHFHVFVGDLSAEVDNKVLQDAFAPFGDVTDTKVIRDMQTLKSKGYGFVSYPTREQAERAIEQMNGHWIGSRPIRTNWATRKTTFGSNPTAGAAPSQGSAPNNQMPNVAANAAAMQNYWSYYQQYYNSTPELQQQWQRYWEEQQRAHQQGCMGGGSRPNQ